MGGQAVLSNKPSEGHILCPCCLCCVQTADPSDVGIGNGLSSCVGTTVVYRLLGLFLVTSEKQGRQSVPRPFVVVWLSLSSADVIKSLSN